MATKTKSYWWNDSGNLDEIRTALENGASGVTLNPLLVKMALFGSSNYWSPKLKSMPKTLKGSEKAEEIVRIITCEIASMVEPIYKKTGGLLGRVCAQVAPDKAFDSDSMLKMAKRLQTWAPNIAVKLPVTNAALDTMEECVALGMTVVMTLGFTVSQAVAVAERYEKAVVHSRANGIEPGRCYAVIMIGRLDDYLREANADNRSKAREDDILLAGVAVTKRAYGLFREKRYKAILLPSGLRTKEQAAELAGGDMLFSISPKIQELSTAFAEPFRENVDIPIKPEIINRLMTIRDFARAYEPDGLDPREFIGYAPTQRTLLQFHEAGWQPLETYEV